MAPKKAAAPAAAKPKADAKAKADPKAKADAKAKAEPKGKVDKAARRQGPCFSFFLLLFFLFFGRTVVGRFHGPTACEQLLPGFGGPSSPQTYVSITFGRAIDVWFQF